MWERQPLTALRASTACTGKNVPLPFIYGLNSCHGIAPVALKQDIATFGSKVPSLLSLIYGITEELKSKPDSGGN
jgi:hypothetical protein